MRLHSPLRLLAGLGLSVSIGCATTIVSPARDGPLDCGIRYYRPKPYLLIQPPNGAATDEFVTLKLTWMPDFGEDYSVHIKGGIGTNTTTVTLKDGWQLNELNTDTDAKVDEFLGSISSLLGTKPALLGKLGGGDGSGAAGSSGPTTRSYSCQVRAHEVPIGFYEAVINPGPDGKKQLYGWRYVGFAPYGQCPIAAGGAVQQPCESADLFGLIVVKGEMHFVRLPELATTRSTVQVSKKAP